MSESPHIFEATTVAFQDDVLQASLTTPIVIDFYATWCGPCKTLTPLLEKLAKEYGGAFRLAKVNVDTEAELANAFQIRSVPTVILMKAGQPADGFPGVIAESKIRQLLQQHGITASIEEDAAAIDQMTPQQYRLHCQTALQADPENPERRLDLAIALTNCQDYLQAEPLLVGLPDHLLSDPRTRRVTTYCQLAHDLEKAPALEQLQRICRDDPTAIADRLQLGGLLLLAQQNQQALEQFLEAFRLDRQFNESQPRRDLLNAFTLIDDADLVSHYRRKMAALVF